MAPILQVPTTVGHTRLTDTVTQVVADTLRTAAMGEKVVWEAAFQLFPTPNGPQPVVAIYLQIPSPLVGQWMAEVVLVEAPRATAAVVAEGVSTAVGKLFEMRAQVRSPLGI